MSKVSAAQLLREKFDQDLKSLQNNCKHKKTTWLEQCHLYPGHCGGMVRVCDNCDSVLESQP